VHKKVLGDKMVRNPVVHHNAELHRLSEKRLFNVPKWKKSKGNKSYLEDMYLVVLIHKAIIIQHCQCALLVLLLFI